MKKAEADNCASTSVSVKTPFTAATNGSINEVMNPQAKNRVVTARKAPRVDRCDDVKGRTPRRFCRPRETGAFLFPCGADPDVARPARRGQRLPGLRPLHSKISQIIWIIRPVPLGRPARKIIIVAGATRGRSQSGRN